MNWINGFEAMCYCITAMLMVDMFARRRRDELWLFVAASVAGYVLELAAVRVTGIYHYSTSFWISLGFAPYQFPFFGGIMWGGLTVCARRCVQKLPLSPIMRALAGGFLVVTMDVFLDVAAIRLDGGFWVWDGRVISLAVDHHMFMSVIWVNFLGYLFETPAILYFFERWAPRREGAAWPKQLLWSLALAGVGIAFVGAASGASLGLNAVTDEWFACVGFVALWGFTLVRIVMATAKARLRFAVPRHTDWACAIYWAAMYGFCIAALAHLGIASRLPLYFACCIGFGAGTLYLAALDCPVQSQPCSNALSADAE